MYPDSKNIKDGWEDSHIIDEIGRKLDREARQASLARLDKVLRNTGLTAREARSLLKPLTFQP